MAGSRPCGGAAGTRRALSGRERARIVLGAGAMGALMCAALSAGAWAQPPRDSGMQERARSYYETPEETREAERAARDEPVWLHPPMERGRRLHETPAFFEGSAETDQAMRSSTHRPHRRWMYATPDAQSGRSTFDTWYDRR